MSGTRSPSQREPVTEAILVSHGQPSDQQSGEDYLRTLAGQIGRLLPGWHIRSATLATPGLLEKQLGACRPEPLVFPVFMADGWFIKSALAARLQNFNVTQLPPLGVHPDLPELTACLLEDYAKKANWQLAHCTILLAAHGSATGKAAARCTYRFADALKAHLPASEIHCGFLEQSPRLVDVAATCGAKTLELPVFAGAGGHVTQDVPEALNAAGFKGIRLPALGQAPAIPDLIARTLKQAAQQSMAA